MAKSAFVTHTEQDELIEKLKKKNPDPRINWDWVRDSILWTGSGGLDIDSSKEDVKAAIDLEK